MRHMRLFTNGRLLEVHFGALKRVVVDRRFARESGQ